MSLNALKNHLLSGFCPKVVKVPIQAHITDKRVVLCNTTLVYISWIIALVCYVFVFKGWSKAARVQISYNMWIDPSTVIVQQPANVPYCDNPACEKRSSQSLLVSKRNMLNPTHPLFFLFFFFLLPSRRLHILPSMAVPKHYLPFIRCQQSFCQNNCARNVLDQHNVCGRTC